VLYGIAAVRYGELYRRRRRPLPLAVLVAFILMAEAMIAVAFSRTWHAMVAPCPVAVIIHFR
jgi:adenylate cyclase